MITCSAPGKVYLFGEHAVVYGEPAIACAIDRRVFTSVKLSASGRITIDSMGKRQNCYSEEFRYACSAAQAIKELAETDFSAEITIRSQLPPSQGLGSSAAVTVSTIKALTECLGMALQDEEIARIGHKLEYKLQGRASPADTFVSAIGGAAIVEHSSAARLVQLDVPIVIGATGITRSTGDVVGSVALMREKYPSLIGNIMSSIGDITRLGRNKLTEKDIAGIGELMNINQGLLESMGVSDIALSKLIYAARNEGALGAKMTGAGRGGCMFAIARERDVDAVSEAMVREGAQVLETAFSDLGLRIERQRM